MGRDPGDHNEADLQQQRWWCIMAARCLGWPHELAAGGAARCWLGTVFSQVLCAAWSSSMQADQHSMLLINLHCSFSHVPVVCTCWARSATSRPITIWSSPKCWTTRVRVLVICALLHWLWLRCPSVLHLCSSPRLQLELQMCLSCLALLTVIPAVCREAMVCADPHHTRPQCCQVNATSVCSVGSCHAMLCSFPSLPYVRASLPGSVLPMVHATALYDERLWPMHGVSSPPCCGPQRKHRRGCVTRSGDQDF